jgi:hypothetical protein
MILEITAQIIINASREAVWAAITDMDNSGEMISGIMRIKVLERPAEGLVGLRWEETRMMFGREAMETMWITGAEEVEYYETRAESHGSIYITRLSLNEVDGGTQLTMTFTSIAESFGAKLASFIMGPFIKGSLRKALVKDLEDIKGFLEGRKNGNQDEAPARREKLSLSTTHCLGGGTKQEMDDR